MDWIKATKMENLNIMELYATGVYFAMQTLTTVGYGDIEVVTSDEMLMCIAFEFIGVIFFSFAAGSLTNILSNSDNIATNNHENIIILNRLQSEFNLTKELYI